MALDDGVVALVDGALLERPLEHGVGVLGLRDDHHPGRADVETVHDALALVGAGGTHAAAGRGQPAQDGRPVPAAGGVRRDADGLVDHDDVVVLVQDREPGHDLGRRGDHRRTLRLG